LEYCIFQLLRLVFDTAALAQFSCPGLRGMPKLLYFASGRAFASKFMKPNSRLPSHQAGRPLMATFGSDEDSERIPRLRDGAHRSENMGTDLAKSQVKEVRENPGVGLYVAT
jgi:hypothetical protein